jgi:DNA-binding ferritin-like protein
MTNGNEHTPRGADESARAEQAAADAGRIEEEVKAAVGGETADVREDVRRITLEALSDLRLDTERVKRVAQAVVDGARRGTAAGDERGREKLSAAMKGLDEALAAAAEATNLAVREAVGRGTEFSRQELHRAVENLSRLESAFIDTLGATARNTGGFVADTLSDLADHARRSGTSVGERVNSSLSQLRQAVGDMASTQLEAGAQALRGGGAALADVAAGFLAGIADRLRKERPKEGGPDGTQSRD